MENTKLKSFKDLMVWQKAVDLAVLVYSITEKFPKSELYGITNQMRRSAVSISSNIAEGFKRNHQKEKLQFYNVAYASTSELESQIEVSRKLNFLDNQDYQRLSASVVEVGKMIDGLIKSQNRNFPKSHILNPIFFLVFLYSIFHILNPSSTFAAELILSSSVADLAVGQQFAVDVMLDAQSEAINAVEARILFPQDLLKLEQVYETDSTITLWVEKPLAVAGTVSFSGIIPGGFSGVLSPYYQGVRPGQILKLVFSTKQEGKGIIEARGLRILLNDGQGSEGKAEIKNFSFEIKGRALETGPGVALQDSDSPELFTPQVAQDVMLNGGQKTLIFSAQDKGSGIDYYEVAEQKGKPAENYIGLSWRRATSPFLLEDQNLESWIYVKAVDKFGNQRIVQVSPRPEKYQKNWIWVIILAGIAIGLLILRLRPKKLN